MAAKKVRYAGTVKDRTALVDRQSEALSVRRQCELLEVSRGAFYYNPVGESQENLSLMRVIDELHIQEPTFGYPRITALLRRMGHGVNEKRVARLMRVMGIEAIYQKPKTSTPCPGHKIFPYLLKDRIVSRPNEVWCADITYIPMPRGFLYLVAVMDWFSRYVLAWELSNTLEADFCVAALDRALAVSLPEIFNTDQGSQFTSEEFTSKLLDNSIKVSMDGRGRFLDNIFIERLWRSYKYEDVYLHCHDTVQKVHLGATDWFHRYNTFRPHQALGYATPEAVYRNAA